MWLSTVPRKTLTLSLLVVGLCLLVVVQISARISPDKPVQAVVKSTPTKHVTVVSKAAGPSYPVRLRIPKLSVTAPLDYVGLTAAGQLDSPKLPGNAGWYYKGVKPGEKGSAVIDGHYGWKNNLPAVFDNLHTLQAGDEVLVDDERGIVSTFVVTAIRSYGEEAEAKDVFNSTDGKVHLNLITCEGSWSNTRKSYSSRLVVFTDKK